MEAEHANEEPFPRRPPYAPITLASLRQSPCFYAFFLFDTSLRPSLCATQSRRIPTVRVPTAAPAFMVPRPRLPIRHPTVDSRSAAALSALTVSAVENWQPTVRATQSKYATHTCAPSSHFCRTSFRLAGAGGPYASSAGHSGTSSLSNSMVGQGSSPGGRNKPEEDQGTSPHEAVGPCPLTTLCLVPLTNMFPSPPSLPELQVVELMSLQSHIMDNIQRRLRALRNERDAEYKSLCDDLNQMTVGRSQLDAMLGELEQVRCRAFPSQMPAQIALERDRRALVSPAAASIAMLALLPDERHAAL